MNRDVLESVNRMQYDTDFNLFKRQSRLYYFIWTIKKYKQVAHCGWLKAFYLTWKFPLAIPVKKEQGR